MANQKANQTNPAPEGNSQVMYLKLSSVKEMLRRIEEFKDYLQTTPFQNMVIREKLLTTYDLQEQEMKTETETSISIDCDYIDSEEEYREYVNLISDVMDFHLEKRLSGSFMTLNAEEDNIKLSITIWFDYKFKKDDEEFLPFISKVSGCNMVRKTTYSPAYSSTSVVCELKQ